MREIKFRGRVPDKGWLYGDLRYIGNNLIYIVDKFGHGSSVNPSTVGQFTGLKDADGLEIYEGDVIQVVTKNPYWAFKKNYDVYWDLDGFCLEGEPLYYWFKLHDLKVIGNVHDNPDLLEVEHD